MKEKAGSSPSLFLLDKNIGHRKQPLWKGFGAPPDAARAPLGTALAIAEWVER
jgi:hypothetical protein